MEDKIFYVYTSCGFIIKTINEIIGNLYSNNYYNMYVNKEGLCHLQTCDKSGIITSHNLEGQWFNRYYFNDKYEPIGFKINTTELGGRLKTIKKKTALRIYVDEKDLEENDINVNFELLQTNNTGTTTVRTTVFVIKCPRTKYSYRGFSSNNNYKYKANIQRNDYKHIVDTYGKLNETNIKIDISDTGVIKFFNMSNSNDSVIINNTGVDIKDEDEFKSFTMLSNFIRLTSKICNLASIIQVFCICDEEKSIRFIIKVDTIVNNNRLGEFYICKEA